MATLRQALAFPMYGASAWLAWVVAQQASSEGLARLFAAALALALAAWLWGLAQRRRAGGKAGWAPAIPAALGLALAVVALAGTRPAPAAQTAAAATAQAIASVPYDPGRLAELRAAGRPVLVNFTAAWCVTCQFNERAALTAAETVDAFRRTGAVYMVGDWTNRDSVIAKALADQGRVGVPLYLVYAPGVGAPRVLPQLLTPGLISQALQAAAVKPPAAAGR
jgi:thiol:disulfide interchange protein DsbD